MRKFRPRTPKRTATRQKFRALVSVFLVFWGLFLMDLHLIFNPIKLEKIVKKKLENLLESTVEITGFSFDFSDQLFMETLSIRKKGKFHLILSKVAIFHHPYLALVGIYYPQSIEIERGTLHLMDPRGRPDEIWEVSHSLFPLLKRLHHMNIRDFSMTLSKGDLFAQETTLFLDRIRVTPSRNQFKIDSLYTRLGKSKILLYPLPWEGMELDILYQHSPPKLKIDLKVHNFKLHQGQGSLVPPFLAELEKETPLRGIWDVNLHYTHQFPHKTLVTGEIKGYNIGMRFLKKKELTNGEICINLKEKGAHIPFFTGLLDRKPFHWKGDLIFATFQPQLKGQFLESSKAKVNFLEKTLSEILEKLFQ